MINEKWFDFSQHAIGSFSNEHKRLLKPVFYSGAYSAVKILLESNNAREALEKLEAMANEINEYVGTEQYKIAEDKANEILEGMKNASK